MRVDVTEKLAEREGRFESINLCTLLMGIP
jgi:hypothetical protein